MEPRPKQRRLCTQW